MVKRISPEQKRSKMNEYWTVYANLHVSCCYGVSSPDAVSYTRRERNSDEPSATGKIIFQAWMHTGEGCSNEARTPTGVHTLRTAHLVPMHPFCSGTGLPSDSDAGQNPLNVLCSIIHGERTFTWRQGTTSRTKTGRFFRRTAPEDSLFLKVRNSMTICRRKKGRKNASSCIKMMMEIQSVSKKWKIPQKVKPKESGRPVINSLLPCPEEKFEFFLPRIMNRQAGSLPKDFAFFEEMVRIICTYCHRKMDQHTLYIL